MQGGDFAACDRVDTDEVGCFNKLGYAMRGDPLKGKVMLEPFRPPGHFYSPEVNVDEVAARSAAVWPNQYEALGVDFNPASHREILTQIYPRYIHQYDYAESADEAAPESFYTKNDYFSLLDSRTLFVLLRAWHPRRIVEVGSGYSSLLMADVKRRFLNGETQITCIEPYPREFLRSGSLGIDRLVEQQVQDVPLSEFEGLDAGDLLFIDSSHVSKTGSDVNHLYFEVLPRLRPGVRIHIHDIFLPDDYPKDWVLVEKRSWNEQYILRALLMYTRGFRVLFGCSYAFAKLPHLVEQALNCPPGKAYGGGSIYLERLASR